MKVAATPSIASRIELAFQSASTTTGADFGYLVKTAERESNFNVSAKATTSTATGLFQFIESTWLETMKQSGAEHGLGDYAKDITQRADGKYVVSDPARRREILDLRKDPEIASVMAGELTAKNGAYLEKRLGREPTDGELYIAHFLGANGASRLISMAEGTPDARADAAFSRQAKANRSIFYERSGEARSASEVYDTLVRKHDAPSPTRYAAVIPAGETVPLPVAKASVTDALPAMAIAAADIGQAAGRDTGTISPLAIAPAASSSGSAVASGDARSVTFPAARAEPLGGFAFLSSGVADLQERLTAMHAEAADPVETPVATDGAVVASAAGAAGGSDGRANVAVSGLRPAPTSDAAVLLAAEDPSQFAQLSTAAVPVASSQASGTVSGAPSDRVASAWRATAPSSAFQALFRNDASASREPLNPSYLNAFSVQQDAGPEPLFTSRAAGETARGTGAEATGASAQVASAVTTESSGQRGPLNLIGALRYQIFREPEDVLPPA